MKCLALCLAVSGWLSAHGYDDIRRPAVLRSIYLESRFQPCVTRGPRGSGYFLQWLGPRRVALERFARSTRCPSWETQMEFMDMELRSGRYPLFWATRDGRMAFRVMREQFGRGR